MLVAERKANVLDRIQLVEDEQVLKMIEAMLDVHLEPEAGASDGQMMEAADIPYFNPLDHHTPEAIKLHESRADFWGYGTDGEPVYGDEVDKSYQEWIKGVKDGSIIPITHEEIKAKWDKKFKELRLS